MHFQFAPLSKAMPKASIRLKAACASATGPARPEWEIFSGTKARPYTCPNVSTGGSNVPDLS